MNTDSRHESPASLEQVKSEKSSTEEHSVSKEDKDDISTNSPEKKRKKEEFAVPIIPSLHRRKNRKSNKDDENETKNIEKTETLNKPPADSECQLGRKRTGSDGETDVQQDQNVETEENVSLL